MVQKQWKRYMNSQSYLHCIYHMHAVFRTGGEGFLGIPAKTYPIYTTIMYWGWKPPPHMADAEKGVFHGFQNLTYLAHISSARKLCSYSTPCFAPLTWRLWYGSARPLLTPVLPVSQVKSPLKSIQEPTLNLFVLALFQWRKSKRLHGHGHIWYFHGIFLYSAISVFIDISLDWNSFWFCLLFSPLLVGKPWCNQSSYHTLQTTAL